MRTGERSLRHLEAGDQEPLISPRTAAQKRMQLEHLVSAVSASAPTGGNTDELKRSPDGVLAISPRMYREYAAEYKELARTATDWGQRAIYLKMANTWIYTSIRFEAGLEDKRPL
jgi:hypothetical protein